ncbi:MAG: ArdC-like ssDNA-binding domain-containing protein [candidate division Zixibacteria bacterium]|nr:ArdC-like ssDNA-binding domain-containing protein [candidate division Zixibacteria bacterium]
MSAGKRHFDKEAWAEQKQQERQNLFDTIEEMADKTLSDSGALTDYLNMQSMLGKTSVGNTLLVIAQRPDATYIADYDDWQKKGRSVRKGEKAILILEADREYTRDDGTVGVNFKAKRVFDMAQTYGQPLHQRAQAPIKVKLRALMTDTPVPVKLSDNVSQDIGALYSREDKTVYVARGLDGDMLFKLIACELAHAELGGSDAQMAAFASSCAANLLCKRYGVNVPEYDCIPESVSSLSTQDKRSILGKIREAACDMSERIDRNLSAERQQQRKQDNPQR